MVQFQHVFAERDDPSIQLASRIPLREVQVEIRSSYIVIGLYPNISLVF